jgi:hypothetical protein
MKKKGLVWAIFEEYHERKGIVIIDIAFVDI